MTVGDHQLVMNGIDFKALLKAFGKGSVPAPELAANLDRVRLVEVFP